MKTGIVIPRKNFSLKAQVEILDAVPALPRSQIYVNGERGETPEAAYKAARDKLVHAPDGFRVFGTSQKAIRAALIVCEKMGVVIVDHARGWRSDKNFWEMYDWAVGKGQAEERGLNPRASRKGGNARAAKLEADRLADDKAEKVWFNLKRFDTDGDACKHMNELHPPKASGGWNPQTARRHFGPSGRPRGNRSFRIRK